MWADRIIKCARLSAFQVALGGLENRDTATGFTVSTAYSGTLCYRELALPIAGPRGDRRKRLLLLLFYLQHFNVYPGTAVPNFSIGNMPPFYFSAAPPKIH